MLPFKQLIKNTIDFLIQLVFMPKTPTNFTLTKSLFISIEKALMDFLLKICCRKTFWQRMVIGFSWFRLQSVRQLEHELETWLDILQLTKTKITRKVPQEGKFKQKANQVIIHTTYLPTKGPNCRILRVLPFILLKISCFIETTNYVAMWYGN